MAHCLSGANNCTFHQSACIVDHLVARLQSGAKDCTFYQSDCIVDHLVAHCSSRAKNGTFHQSDCISGGPISKWTNQNCIFVSFLPSTKLQAASPANKRNRFRWMTIFRLILILEKSTSSVPWETDSSNACELFHSSQHSNGNSVIGKCNKTPMIFSSH